MNDKRKKNVRVKNQQRILKAAEQEFEQHGFGGARIQRVADRAGLPKANVHYYYRNKSELYAAVIGHIVQLWNDAFDRIDAEDDPATALEDYIRAKLEYSRTNPSAARIFSNEIIQGAPHLKQYLKSDLRDWVSERAGVIQHWIDQGRIDAVDPYHLIFLIWSATQHYADYYVQVTAIQGKNRLTMADFQAVGDSLVGMILKGCGLKPNPVSAS